jgi:CubicO group peptidase (beta-lactamase class C family)
MSGHVDRGTAPGLVSVVCRGGEVHAQAVGKLAAGASAPMRRDTIFRITSMTKPITAVATMILVERGKLRLDDAVDHELPELADRVVLSRRDGPLDDTVPARRPISVRDLLSYRFGFGDPMQDETPVLAAARELGLRAVGPPMPRCELDPETWIRRFGTLPLMHQPGERWLYNTSAHVLGVLIARAADQPLEEFLRERLFEPLGMKDTGFSVPPAERDRLASCYRGDGHGGLVLQDGVETSPWARAPSFPDAAAGLLSTADDYLAFARMLLAGGKHDNARVLSKSSIEALTTAQLDERQQREARGFLGERSWGLGLAVAPGGAYGWDGGFGTSWRNDPVEDLVGVLMTQRLWDTPTPPAVIEDFWAATYQAIDA